MIRCCSSIIAVVALLALAGPADAYPFFQRSSGTDTCGACHIAPSGGGPLTEWGRSEAGDTIAAGGDGQFLHGAVDLPDWLTLQGDVRLALLAHETGSPEGTELAAFPMQLEVAAAARLASVRLVVSAGLRAQVRNPGPGRDQNDAGTVENPGFASYLTSREHYLLWRPSAAPVYARAGRFYAPYGLRLHDHTAYSRRYLGFGLFEETYGLAVGYLGRRFESHLTAFTSDRWQDPGRSESGVAALHEHRFGDLVVAGQAKVGVSDSDTRVLAGGYAKLWMESASVLWIAELDVGRQWFHEQAGDRWQSSVLLGPVFVPTRGLYLGAAYERYDSDWKAPGVVRHSGSVWTSYWPNAHLEIAANLRGQALGPSDGAVTGLLQLHYFL